MVAAAHVAPAGFYFFANSGTPTVAGMPRSIMVKRITAQFTIIGATAMPTAPRLALSQADFTGVLAHSGGTGIDPAYLPQNPELDPQGSLRTVSTGLTAITARPGILAQFLPPVLTQATAVGLVAPTSAVFEWRPIPGDEPIVKVNEALIVHQPDAGTASDGRQFILGIETMEFRT